MDSATRNIKWIGLFCAIVLPVILATSRLWTHNTNYDFTLWSYLLFVAPFTALLIILVFIEKEPLSSLGSFKLDLRTTRIILLQLLICIVVNFIVLNIINILKYTPKPEPMYEKIQQFPVWGKILLATWAGISEEVSFRGYAVTRLTQLTGSKAIALIAPILLFGLGHGANGSVFHIAYAMIIGIIFLIFYVKTKNLMANIISHSVFDILFLVIFPMMHR